jgi:hypothetical protein
LGYIARDNGHSRVPEPPDKITGTIIVCVGPEEDILIFLRLV